MRSLYRAHAVGFQWVRGRARHEGGAIVLDPISLTSYKPFADDVTDYPYELAAINEPQDAVDFARRYGLLRHGPDADEYREPWPEWEEAALRVRGIGRLGVDLGQALKGDGDAKESIRAHAKRWGDQFEAPAASDEEALAQASLVVASMVDDGLQDVGFGIQAEVGLRLPDGSEGRSGGFAFSPRAPDLLSLIYYALSLALVERVPGRTCDGCGRVFLVRDPRQRYHDTRCAQRTRYRRWADNRRES